MIKFFRKIRQTLLAQNKLSKYLIYAVGEIILVVIEILIALSINNWNENLKLNQKEIALLNELSYNLEKTKQAIDTSLFHNNEILRDNNFLLSFMQTNQEYHPKLDTIFGQLPYWNTPYLTQNAYQNIKSIGVEIISNPILRNQIVDLYEEDLPKLLNDWDRWEWDINQTLVMPFFAKHIRGDMTNRDFAKPNNFEDLKSNEEFYNILSVIYRTRIYGITLMEETLIEIQNLQNSIVNYLNK